MREELGAGPGMFASMLLLERLMQRALELKAGECFLEVRASNQPALALYQRTGFVAVGQRRAYYPTHTSEREDAVVMRLPLPACPPEAPC